MTHTNMVETLALLGVWISKHSLYVSNKLKLHQTLGLSELDHCLGENATCPHKSVELLSQLA